MTQQKLDTNNSVAPEAGTLSDAKTPSTETNLLDSYRREVRASDSAPTVTTEETHAFLNFDRMGRGIERGLQKNIIDRGLRSLGENLFPTRQERVREQRDELRLERERQRLMDQTSREAEKRYDREVKALEREEKEEVRELTKIHKQERDALGRNPNTQELTQLIERQKQEYNQLRERFDVRAQNIRTAYEQGGYRVEGSSSYQSENGRMQYSRQTRIGTTAQDPNSSFYDVNTQVPAANQLSTSSTQSYLVAPTPTPTPTVNSSTVQPVTTQRVTSTDVAPTNVVASPSSIVPTQTTPVEPTPVQSPVPTPRTSPVPVPSSPTVEAQSPVPNPQPKTQPVDSNASTQSARTVSDPHKKLLDSLVSQGLLKDKDKEALIGKIASGAIRSDDLEGAILVISQLKDAEWVSKRLADGGVALLRMCPTKELYRQYAEHKKNGTGSPFPDPGFAEQLRTLNIENAAYAWRAKALASTTNPVPSTPTQPTPPNTGTPNVPPSPNANVASAQYNPNATIDDLLGLTEA